MIVLSESGMFPISIIEETISQSTKYIKNRAITRENILIFVIQILRGCACKGQNVSGKGF
jgi:hypothetical protein